LAKCSALPVEERMEGTAATVAIGIANGADAVRVHDVKAMARVARHGGRHRAWLALSRAYWEDFSG
jgi:dihydropteroate synthase